MEEFKVIFVNGYKKIRSFEKDKADVNIVFNSGNIYYTTLITIEKIKELMIKYNETAYLDSNFLIVKDLQKETIKKAIEKSIDMDYHKQVFLNNNIKELYSGLDYNDLADMNDLPDSCFWNNKICGKNFKITCPGGYCNVNVENDNIDINIVFETNEVYFGTAITSDNVNSFLIDGHSYFWTTNMFILKDLKKETIRSAVNECIFDTNFKQIFSRIGYVGEVFNGLTYEDIVDIKNIDSNN